ncbi:hypothetical protein Daesc_003677 [Daldinia eschscholtzii]|uniref:Uncharacterized protein n=1 Tax=Daldinia eschscholtzii TaxID=292717 RepID=A0AAX6MTN6_9PEZI
MDTFNYEGLLPALVEFSSSTSKPVNVAWVFADPIGKSTVLVPDLWKRVKAARPETRGLYIVCNQVEAELVASNVAQLRATDVISKIPSADDAHEQLGVISFDRFNKAMTDSGDQPCPLDHECSILFADMEQIQTVDGDMTIGILVNWIRGLRRLKDGVRVTVIFLADRHLCRLDVDDVFYAHEIRPAYFEWDERVAYDEFKIDESGVTHFIRSALFESPQTDAAPWVVLFAPDREVAFAEFVEPLARDPDRRIRWASVDGDTEADRIVEMMSADEPTVLFVRNDFSSCLPLKNLRCAISFPYKKVRMFDPSTSQFPLADIPISDGDLHRQRAWVAKSAKAGGNVAEFYRVWDGEWFRASKSDNKAPIRGDTMRLLLEASKTFGGLAFPEVPVPSLRGSPSLLGETHRRLVIMNCISLRTPTSEITPMGKKVLFYLKHKGFNHSGSTEVAHLLARIETNPELSLPGKRVLILMAAVTANRPMYELTDEAARSILNEDMEALNAIREDCAGVGKENADYGQLWCELGIWTKIAAEDTADRAVVEGRDFVEMADGYMRVSVNSCVRIADYVKNLEAHLGIKPCKDMMAETALAPAELEPVFETLAWSYLFQMVFFNYDLISPPGDFISLHPVDLSLTPSLAAFRSEARKNPQDCGGFATIYQEATINRDKLAPRYLTMIPNDLPGKMIRYAGADNLFSLVATTFPVPPI